MPLLPGLILGKTIIGTGGADGLVGTQWNDILSGAAGRDVLDAGAGDDLLFGGRGEDKLDGGDGDDLLNGGRGSDTLIGGAGNDRLTGGLGKDFFVASESNNGRDVVADFQDGIDKIRFDGGVVFDAINIASDGHGNATISWDGGELVVMNVAVSQLTAADFIF